MSDFIDLSDYFTTDEAGEQVLKPFTETKSSEDVYQCTVHNKGTGPVIDLFLDMYREGLRQQWFYKASKYNKNLKDVRDWNANKPVSEGLDGGQSVPEDRPEPEPPTAPNILTVEEYKTQMQPFMEAAANDNKRSRMYGSYAALGSWRRVIDEFGYPAVL